MASLESPLDELRADAVHGRVDDPLLEGAVDLDARDLEGKVSEVGLGHLVKGVVDLRNRYKNRSMIVIRCSLFRLRSLKVA